MLSSKQVSLFNKPLQWLERKGQALTNLQLWKNLYIGKRFVYFHLVGLAFSASWQTATYLQKIQNEKMSKDKEVVVVSSYKMNPIEGVPVVLLASYFGFNFLPPGIHRHFLELPILYHMNKMGYHVRWLDKTDKNHPLSYLVGSQGSNVKGAIMIGHGAQGKVGTDHIMLGNKLDFFIKLSCDSKDDEVQKSQDTMRIIYRDDSPNEYGFFKNDPAYKQGQYQKSINAKRIFSYREMVLHTTLWFDAIQGFGYISAKSGYARTFTEEVKSLNNDLPYFDKVTFDSAKYYYDRYTNSLNNNLIKLREKELIEHFFKLSEKYLALKKIISENKENLYKTDLISLETKIYERLKRALPLVVDKLTLRELSGTDMSLMNLFPELKNRFIYLVSQSDLSKEYELNEILKYAEKNELPTEHLKKVLDLRGQKSAQISERNYLDNQKSERSIGYLDELLRHRKFISSESIKKYCVQEYFKMLDSMLPKNKQTDLSIYKISKILKEMKIYHQHLDPKLFSDLKDKRFAFLRTSLLKADQKIFGKYDHIYNVKSFLDFLERAPQVTEQEINVVNAKIEMIYILIHLKPEKMRYSDLNNFNEWLGDAHSNMTTKEYAEFINTLMETDPQKSIHPFYQSLIWDHPERRKLKNREWPEPWSDKSAALVDRTRLEFDENDQLQPYKLPEIMFAYLFGISLVERDKRDDRELGED